MVQKLLSKIWRHKAYRFTTEGLKISVGSPKGVVGLITKNSKITNLAPYGLKHLHIGPKASILNLVENGPVTFLRDRTSKLAVEPYSGPSIKSNFFVTNPEARLPWHMLCS
jgi:hypothetical protein